MDGEAGVSESLCSFSAQHYCLLFRQQAGVDHSTCHVYMDKSTEPSICITRVVVDFSFSQRITNFYFTFWTKHEILFVFMFAFSRMKNSPFTLYRLTEIISPLFTVIVYFLISSVVSGGSFVPCLIICLIILQCIHK